MKGKRFRSINFILWISFLAFAAFILLMTWVFQTTLLRRFFTDEVKSDLEEIGGDVYRNISALQFAGENAGESIDAYIALAQYDNPSINIYVLDKNSVCLYPTNLEDGEEFGIEGVDKEVFSFILDQLELDLIDFEVDEVFVDDEKQVNIYGPFESYGQIQAYLEGHNMEITSGEFIRIPTDTKEVTEEQRQSIHKLIDKLEEDDDVVNVFHNMKEEDTDAE